MLPDRNSNPSDAVDPTIQPANADVTRRTFIVTLAVSATVLAFDTPLEAEEAPLGVVPPADSPIETIDVELRVNGVNRRLTMDPRVTLLDALRERMALTGTKKGCDHGQCGACTVHIDGRRALACLTLAAAVGGKAITTIEGLASGDRLHPMQQAFLDHDGFQCGYCTPGQIMSAVALLDEPCGQADADVRECMSGNICRCGAYNGIVEAVQSVRLSGAGVSRS